MIAKVERAVELAGGEVTQLSNDRLAAVFRSGLFRFKDDVTFFVDTDDQELHFRSASRVGHSDLGANRKRMEGLTTAIKSALERRWLS